MYRLLLIEILFLFKGFFNVDFSEAGLVDYNCMLRSSEQNEKTELEIAKVDIQVDICPS